MSDPRFCPKCGAGLEKKVGNSAVFRLPRGYPFDPPCEECAERSKRHWQNVGKKIAERFHEEVLKNLTS